MWEEYDRDVEERTQWPASWGHSVWMLVGSTAQKPTRAELDYVNGRAAASCRVLPDTLLTKSRIVGMALAVRPQHRVHAVPTDEIWRYDTHSTLGRWAERMQPYRVTKKGETAVESKHWTWRHVLRFTDTHCAPWYTVGMPKRLATYGVGGEEILDWARRQYTLGRYTVVR